jgi:YVTN family beta-propeller protein
MTSRTATSLLAALILALLSAAGVCAGRGASGPTSPPSPSPAVEGNRGPARVALSADGSRAYVTEADEGTVAVIDTATFRVEARLPSGGEAPDGLAIAPGGRRLLVANSQSGSLGVIDLAAGRLLRSLPLRGAPAGVAISPEGRTAYVSLGQLDAVAVVDLDSEREIARIPVGRRPRSLALSQDGSTLCCANQSGGSLSIIDTKSRAERRVDLAGTNIRGVAVHHFPEGDSFYATVQPPLNRTPASYTIDVWHNFVKEVTLRGPDARVAEEQWMDFGSVGSPDQEEIAISPDGRFAYVAVGGRHAVSQITIHDGRRQAIWPFSFRQTTVGANPRGLALSADGARLWVANRLGNSVSVIDTSAMVSIRTLDLGPASRADPSVYGRFLFSSAHLGRDGRFSCNTCHPDGCSDGLTWRFAHVADGLDVRNTRDLRGGILETPPYRWTGATASLERFIQEEITGLMQGPPASDSDLAALRLAITSFRLPPNPYRGPDGQLTAAGARGRLLFEGKGACAECHSGGRLGGTGRKAWVGSTPPGLLLDVPHLTGVYDSPPFLHDGSAATLEAVLTTRNGERRHGNAHQLSEAELQDLIEYVREQ